MANTILRTNRTAIQDADFSARFPAMMREIVLAGDQLTAAERNRLYAEIIAYLQENARATETTRNTPEGVNGFISLSGQQAWYITTRGTLVTLSLVNNSWYKLNRADCMLYREGHICTADINRIKALEGRE